MEKNKNLEYYLDSSIYSGEEIQKNIEKTKKEFPNKKVKVSIGLNEFGMYIITFQFENKNSILGKIKIWFWKKFQKIPLLEGKQYGQYKATKTYRPYERKIK